MTAWQDTTALRRLGTYVPANTVHYLLPSIAAAVACRRAVRVAAQASVAARAARNGNRGAGRGAALAGGDDVPGRVDPDLSGAQGERAFKAWFHPVRVPKYPVTPGGALRPVIVANIALLVAGGLEGVVRR